MAKQRGSPGLWLSLHCFWPLCAWIRFWCITANIVAVIQWLGLLLDNSRVQLWEWHIPVLSIITPCNKVVHLANAKHATDDFRDMNTASEVEMPPDSRNSGRAQKKACSFAALAESSTCLRSLMQQVLALHWVLWFWLGIEHVISHKGSPVASSKLTIKLPILKAHQTLQELQIVRLRVYSEYLEGGSLKV